MIKIFVAKICLVVAILGLAWIATSQQVYAQEPDTQSGTLDITLKELGYTDRTLSGPSSAMNYYFTLPPYWRPQEGGYVEFDLTYAALALRSEGTMLLTVRLNETILYASETGMTTAVKLQVPIPPEALFLSEHVYNNNLRVSFEVHDDCERTILTSLTIRSSSNLHLAYIERPLELNLAQYPKPLYYSQAFMTSTLHFILPDHPTQTDLATAALVVARLGRLTGSRLNFEASFVSDLTLTATGRAEHLFVIGRPETNPLLVDGALAARLPVSLARRQLRLSGEMPATIVPEKVFTTTVLINNTTQTTQILTVTDSWPAGASWITCSLQCEFTSPNTLRWKIGALEPRQEVALSAQWVITSAGILPGDRVEHTVSLFDENEKVINVDTLSATVGMIEDGRRVTSNLYEGPYFFAHNNKAIAEGDGLIQEVLSPNPHYAAIVVTGLNDDALLKAGQALGAKTQLPGMFGNYAIVQATRTLSQPVAAPVEDITFASLNYTDQTLDIVSRGTQYNFWIPRSWAVTEKAGLALHFAHSAALDVLSSTIEISVNGVPVSSIFLTEQNRSDWFTVPINPERLLVGNNRLSFQLVGNFYRCMPADEGIWAAIYEDSYFHLPRQQAATTSDLIDFPQPFSELSDLRNVKFLLPESPTQAEVVGLIRLVALLGDAAGGDYFEVPEIVLGGKLDPKNLQGYHLIAIGRPTENVYIAAAKDDLPQPFIPGTDEIRQQIDRVIYRFAPGLSLGYIQELISPWDGNQLMLVVTGSTDEGVNWALSALSDNTLNYNLAGNLGVLIGARALRTADTRVLPPAEAPAYPYAELAIWMTPEATVTPIPTPTDNLPQLTPTPTPSPVLSPTATADVTTEEKVVVRPIWLAPFLILSIVVIVAVSVIYISQKKS